MPRFACPPPRHREDIPFRRHRHCWRYMVYYDEIYRYAASRFQNARLLLYFDEERDMFR